MAIATCFLVLQTWFGIVPPAMATGVYEMPLQSPDEPMWVLDQADVLSRINQSSITGSLANLASSTGNQVHLVTIHRLDYGETVESFTNDLFETWFPTAEEQANQTLLVLDTLTNNAAVRAGDQVKHLLTDGIAASIAQDTLMEPLRKGDRYNQAFLDASDRLIAVLSGKPDPGPPQVQAEVQTEGTFATPEDTKGSNATIWVVALLIAATVIPMATYYLYQAFQ
ncbi:MULTISPECIES: TPM domain-containing protein [unclassified Leptolyngbya]|uniref:photosystem II repair protein Psb32 n=1 Tax=unclassified Leptolyngbya TaxID=2650499 RepID=UPI0018EFE861